MDEQSSENSLLEHQEKDYSMTDVVAIEIDPIDEITELFVREEEKREKAKQINPSKRINVEKLSRRKEEMSPVKWKLQEEIADKVTNESEEEQFEEFAEASDSDFMPDESSDESDGSYKRSQKAKKYKKPMKQPVKYALERTCREKVGQKLKVESEEEKIEQNIEGSNHNLTVDGVENEIRSESTDTKRTRNLRRPAKYPFVPSKPKAALFHCDLCPDRSFTRRNHLASHMHSHMEKSPKVVLYCDMCPHLSFRNKNDVIKHMKSHKRKRNRKVCPLCNKRTFKYGLHMKREHPYARLFKCDFCEKSFPTTSKKKSHHLTHTGEKSILCSLCGKLFASNGLRNRHHKHMHSEKLPHPCKHCDRSFISPSAVEVHFYQMHSDERPYQCETCGKSYSTKKYLRIHKLFHGEKKEQCKICDAKFYTVPSRQFHEKTVHKIIF